MPPKLKVTKQMILDAAFRIVREQGGDALNVRAIAKELGCSTQPVLYQFHSIAEVRAEVVRLADEYHTGYILPGGDAREPFLELGLNYVRFGCEERNLFRFLFQSDQFAGMDFAALFDSPQLEPMLALVARAVPCGADEAKDIFKTFFITVHGYASLLANNAMAYEKDQCETVLRTVFHALIAAKGEEK